MIYRKFSKKKKIRILIIVGRNSINHSILWQLHGSDKAGIWGLWLTLTKEVPRMVTLPKL